MGCTVSKKSSDSSDSKAPQFTDATGGKEEDEDQGDNGSRPAIDRAAIEEQSNFKGEQSLLALAMNGKSSVNSDNDKYASTSLKIRKIAEKPVSEASPREGGIADATTIGGNTGNGGGASISLNPVTSPIKIRIQEPVSSVITIEEHEHSKLLPDLKYSMRASASTEGDRPHHLDHIPGETGGQLGQFGVGFGASPSQPFNAARKLQPITTTTTANTFGGGFNPHVDQQHQAGFPPRDLQPVQGIVPVDRMQYTAQQAGGRGGAGASDAMMPRGRGAGRGFAGPISPLYRGPIQGQVPVAGVGTNGFAGRGAGTSPGAVLAGPRGAPRPLHIVTAQSGGSQRGQTAIFRQPEANRHPVGVLPVLSVTVKKSATGKGSDASDNDDDDDDDDDLVTDDDEVGDWDLDDEPTEELNKPSKVTQASIDSSTSFKKQPPMPIQTSSPLRTAEPPSPQKQTSKFRPTHENANDFGDFATVVGDDDDDDDDSNYGDDNEDVEDWFEADSPTATASTRPKKLPVREPEGSPTKVVPTSPAGMHASSSSPSISPAMTPTTFRHASPPLGNEALKPSPHPPPMQRLPSRQIVATPGNLSSTKPVVTAVDIGSPTVGEFPLKQVSYRSSIMNTGQPVFLPIAGNLGIKEGAGADGNAPIRDTKVVKKKRAELPQRNLPHPTPKFGDWLNSRTMINNYIILESLGSGSYAEVKLCKEKVSGKLFAMKLINRDIMKKDKLGKQSKLDDIKREIAIMKKLNHPNVLRLYEVMDDPSMNKLFLVLEYMKHGDLLSHQKKKHSSSLSTGTGGIMMESLHDRDLHCVVLQVLLGLAYLHEQKIVHGDIKPQNILVGDKDAVKIADFGISQSLYGSKQKLTDTAGTPAFMSPEMCSGEEYSGQMADIWAVGATIFMLKFGNPPFVAKSAMQMFEKIQSDPLVFPFAIDQLLQDLLSGMMIKDPLKRMTLLEVMSHPWVTKEETLSSYSIRQQAPQITVSNDEIEHAIDSKDQFAIIVNIRIQMMKKLQKARQETLERQRRLHHADAEDTSSGDGPVAPQPSTADTGEEHRKVVKLKSPKLKQNKVHTDHHHTSGKSSHADLKEEADTHEMLSNEEINYRSQMFSRKKTGSTAAPNGGGGGKTRDQGNCGFENDADADSASQDTDNDDDDDALSSDDDETAVAQSPQLLDELLLTTLSMPPLAKTKSAGKETHSQDLSSDDRSTFPKDGAIVQPHAAPMIDDKEGFYGESSTLSLHFGVSSLQGRRSTQEDRWVVLPEIKDMVAPKYSKSAFVGLFDGHGGEECSNILHEQLHSWIFRDPHDLTLTPAILQTCFEELDTYVCDYLLQKGDLSGSTATCAILSPSDDGKKIRGIVAHVGDCRLVLSFCNNEVRDITEDHRLTMTAERNRILQLGGRVVNNRVNGVMAITRAFGDLEFKGLLGKRSSGGSGAGASLSSSSSSMSLIPGIVQQNPFQKDEEKIPALLTARPDVHMLELDPAVHEFLLLACDGLWDVMSSEEAAEIFRDRLHFHSNLQLAAKELAQEAIRRYSNDNITVVAIQVGGRGGHPV